jgi:hypothetical protein
MTTTLRIGFACLLAALLFGCEDDGGDDGGGQYFGACAEYASCLVECYGWDDGEYDDWVDDCSATCSQETNECDPLYECLFECDASYSCDDFSECTEACGGEIG